MDGLNTFLCVSKIIACRLCNAERVCSAMQKTYAITMKMQQTEFIKHGLVDSVPRETSRWPCSWLCRAVLFDRVVGDAFLNTILEDSNHALIFTPSRWLFDFFCVLPFRSSFPRLCHLLTPSFFSAPDQTHRQNHQRPFPAPWASAEDRIISEPFQNRALSHAIAEHAGTSSVSER